MRPLGRYLLMALVGIVGAASVVVALHVWADHQTLHALVQIEMARQQAAREAVK